MNESSAPMPTLPKIGKGQFKCYLCRQLFPQKDGNWHHWKSMEVHLCKICDASTKDRPERRSDSTL